MAKYDISTLKKGLIALLQGYGVPLEQATDLILCMVEADMRGVHTHGLSILPSYIKKIEKNGFNIENDIIICKTTAAFSVIDANNQIGAVSAKKCMNIAIEKVAESGIYSVFCRNANTFGPAFYYAKAAADRKLVGICLCNSPSAMPAWGGKRKILGTNPFSIAIPAKKYAPIVIDMATSIVAKSKINEIRKQGGVIPKGWAVDENGNPTTDPVSAIRGMVLPMAGHKGSAIAIAIDIIAGVLSGAGYQNQINRFYSENNNCMNVGQCFIVIDPVMVLDEAFYNKVDDYIDQIHLSGEHVFYPGEIENDNYKCAISIGVEVPEEAVKELTRLCIAKNITEVFNNE